MIKSCYIHIPFCKSICSYCDFCKYYYNDSWVEKYILSLENEIKKRYKNEMLDTLYIGGGTPSCLDIESLNKLFKVLNIFKLNKNYEYTIEFNIEDISEEKLKICKKNKVNRISIGVESFNKDNLNFLNRKNTNIEEKISLVKKYFDNINIDLIYALPNETLDVLRSDLDNFLKLDVPHISCYSLIIEEHTKLHNLGVKNIDEDMDYEMYKLINTKLKDYNHYEISNYAKEGYESRHNLTYWNNEEYYGFGVGAASFIGNKRINTSKSINKYLNNNFVYDEEILSKEDNISYELILGFRKIKGINIEKFNDKFGIDILSLESVKKLVNEDKLVISQGQIYVNEKYLYVENKILEEFV